MIALKWSRSTTITLSGAPVSAACCAISSKRAGERLAVQQARERVEDGVRALLHLGAHQGLGERGEAHAVAARPTSA